MKKLLKLTISIVLGICMLSACKDNKSNAESTGGTDNMTTEGTVNVVDSTEVLNDSNVSGTTSGEMEQVP